MSNAELLGETRRQERIFNDKLGSRGVDYMGLNEQVKEKKRQEEAEKEKQNAFAADMLHNSKLACILQSRQEKEKRAMEKAIVGYRLLYQQPWQQRDYDLNEPLRCRTHPDDVQMMLPGLVGEDPDSEGRRQRQREQIREWLIQQQSELAAKRHQEKVEEQCYNQSTEEIDSTALQLENLEMEKRKAAAIATKEYNLAKAKAEQTCRQEQERNDKVNEAATLNQLLTGAEPVLAVPGLCPSSDRRAPPESLQQVFQFQKYQIEEKKRIELEMKKEADHQDRIRLDSLRAALLLERQQAKLNKQLRRHLDSTNNKLAEIHKISKPDIERGHIDESFFSKFSISRR